MDWKALGVICLLTLALGILLYVPARIWAKRKLRAEPSGHPKLRLTKTGWALICSTVFVLITGFSVQYIAPESAFGQFVKTSGGRFLYLAAVVLIFWLVEAILKTRGIRLIEEDQPDRNR